MVGPGALGSVRGDAAETSAGGTTDHETGELPVTLIRARNGWQLLDFRELYAYRDLFRFLVRREIKVRYAQSAIGVGWAVLQPLCTMLIFTVIFGRLASISSDGVPYALFSFTGLVPWLYFANSVTDGVNSLIANAQMLSKVYFPRMFLPLAAIAARLIDFAVAGTVLVGLMAWYGFLPTWGLLALPWLLVLMVLSAAGVALWLATFAVQFRDVKHALTFVVQVLMYATPVVYPASLIPERYQLWYALNPQVAVVEGFRSMLLGTRDMPWVFLGIGTCSAVMLASSGAFYFTRKQRSFADVA
jgi:lipopolysaccharide transport system permease protein